MRFIWTPVGAAVAASIGLSGCMGDGSDFNVRPSTVGTVSSAEYDGVSNDLLTAGLGKSGLQSAVPPAYANPLQPTAAELRRAAIYNSYRALLDTTAAGGYGSLYGPNVDASGNVTASEGLIAGGEYTAFSDDGTGQQNVTLVVQVPNSFNRSKPCIITATSSGSRGVFGAISTGEWGLKKGCAVAYTDKGTGGAGHDLATDTVPLIDGTRSPSAAAGLGAQFRAPLSATELAAFNTATPNRLAFKHAHSGRNVEKDWGKFTLQAVEFAFYVLNERLGDDAGSGHKARTFRPNNTLVIASSASNGGGSAIAAAEQDTQGLIDGVAVSEPAIEMPKNANVVVTRGGKVQATTARTLLDFTSYAHLYSACAALAPELAGTPFQSTYALPAVYGTLAANRCTGLKNKGLLSATTTATQASEALAKLQAYGWEPEAGSQIATLAGFEVAPAVAVTFANALARASVKDNLCGYSFAATTAAGKVTTVDATALAQMYATGNGVPPSSGVQLVNNNAQGGAVRDLLSVSPSTGLADMGLDGALCLRNLVTGTAGVAAQLNTGIDETRRNGNLRGRPTVIVHGRSDPLLPVNHTSRPYLALNNTVEGSNSQLSYLEVTNAQHFDSFIGLPTVLPGYDTRFVPLSLYLNRALDAVYARLANGTALPPSQVVRTVPRGGTPGAAPALTASNVPAPVATPAAADRIVLSGNTVSIPD
ncbi:MAG: D-(-)-3-hydroxybutyrate oligomer hydrolase [Curvibacter lanceolatus]|uniref:D-(-)-3-hydroxybutyrate oligomer hydrolase n=1 Tax=Curvibacter lanceolatus TaxID=86182 RepID=UPI0023565E75|nr:D-(-)-3-hydroxybutyrate oligomer hydrolase [Curvibacter lanceolatus]MBV5292490.1 D-(-)-3-hydroxybutyrate oligomer hydrolase [Curvibacter lanceolatus]